MYFATTTGMDGKKGWIGRENGERNVRVREFELDLLGRMCGAVVVLPS